MAAPCETTGEVSREEIDRVAASCTLVQSEMMGKFMKGRDDRDAWPSDDYGTKGRDVTGARAVSISFTAEENRWRSHGVRMGKINEQSAHFFALLHAWSAPRMRPSVRLNRREDGRRVDKIGVEKFDNARGIPVVVSHIPSTGSLLPVGNLAGWEVASD